MLIVWGNLSFFIHPLSALITFILCLPYLVVHIKKLYKKDYMKGITGIVLIVLVNLIWMKPFFDFKHIYTRSTYHFQTVLKDIFLTTNAAPRTKICRQPFSCS